MTDKALSNVQEETRLSERAEAQTPCAAAADSLCSLTCQTRHRTAPSKEESNHTSECVPRAAYEELRGRHDRLEQNVTQMNVQIADLELKVRIHEATNYSGRLVWKIRDFNRRYSEARCGQRTSLYSQPFYTDTFGYKLCARLYPFGDGMGKGKYLSLFFVVMKGEYDAILPWPFRHKISFTLFNQKNGQHITDSFFPNLASSSFSKPSGDMNVASGCPLFAQLEQVLEGGFVVEDTLYINISVKTG